jgi:hypothetical protein
MAYSGGSSYERFAQGLSAVLVLSFIAAVIFFRPPPRPEPQNEKAFGCYVAAGAPSILLDKSGMYIRQTDFPKIAYHLERHKLGIALTADAPIVARPAGNRYVYSIEQPGDGLFLDYFVVIDGESYGVFDENALTQFTMLARDGTYLAYRKTSAEGCRAA